jgi:hypothetical protein
MGRVLGDDHGDLHRLALPSAQNVRPNAILPWKSITLAPASGAM